MKKNKNLYFGLAMKCKRIEKRYSQQKLADLVGTTKQSISNYEKGNYFPSDETLKKIKEILGLDVELSTDNNKDKEKVKIELDIDDYGMLLQIRRIFLKMTQTQVAKKIGVIDRANISRYETGKMLPSTEKREKLAEVLDFDFNIGEKLVKQEEDFFSNTYITDVDEQIDKLLSLRDSIIKNLK